MRYSSSTCVVCGRQCQYTGFVLSASSKYQVLVRLFCDLAIEMADTVVYRAVQARSSDSAEGRLGEGT